ncbi:hypothetical protein L6R53_00350 [Myxococcota bacterium]|nr:hypothetical protein [Myxococcota bacterium]
MSKHWWLLGALVALAGLALAVWSLWWVGPAGPPTPVPSPPPAPEVTRSPLWEVVAQRRDHLEACLGHWRRSSPGAPERATLWIEARPLAEAEDAPFALEVSVQGEDAGRLVLEACASAAVQDLATQVTGPERIEWTVGASATPAPTAPPGG